MPKTRRKKLSAESPGQRAHESWQFRFAQPSTQLACVHAPVTNAIIDINNATDFTERTRIDCGEYEWVE